jgi:hypothetical protein
MTREQADAAIARIFAPRDMRIEEDLDNLEKLDARRDLMRWLLEPLSPAEQEAFALELAPALVRR